MGQGKAVVGGLVRAGVLWGLAAVLLGMGVSRGAEPSKGETWAVLIGVGEYEKAAPLQFINNDVRLLAEALKSHAGVPADHIRMVADDVELKPDKATIEENLPAWLQQPKADDTVIVYFSGHGFRDDDGKLYLAPKACDPAAPKEGGIPVEWIRDLLAKCPAAFKLLVLDSCHSGADKALAGPVGVTAKDLGEPFRVSAGVVTLASCTGDEKSCVWEFKEQSLFSYWLKEGLKGHADSDGDAAVTLDELYGYLHGHVVQTAKVRYRRAQTPVRIVGPKTLGVPVVVRLRPQGLKQVLTDMAEQLAGAMEEYQQGKLGVLEFTNDTKSGELLGANFGLLGRFCSEELERKLGDRAAGKFTVVDRGRMQEALKQQRFALQDFNSAARVKNLSASAGGMPVIARGTLRDRAGRLVTLRCKLELTGDEGRLADVGGVAQLSEAEWGMLGRSAEVTVADRTPPAPDAVAPPKEEDRVVDAADKKSSESHPLADANFPYPIKIFVAGKERKGVFKKVEDRIDYVVPVRAGEVYDVRIGNKTGQPVLMKLLVDGLNTLPERENTKGVVTYLWGQRKSLEDARAWVLDPAEPGRPKVGGYPLWAIPGFVTETGREGKIRAFTVVDAEKSLAARRQFTEQIGMITVGFFEPASGSRTVGTDAGNEMGADLTVRGDLTSGKLRAVVHIRYVDAEALK